jgi:hypothetical protein
MSKDVLNYFSNGSSTYENKDKAMLTTYKIQSNPMQIMNSFASAFGLIDNGESLKASFDHLPVMQLD